MAVLSSAGRFVTEEYTDPEVFKWTTDFFRRLLIERHAIRASLENPGGSIILTGVAARTDQSARYSSVIGNDFHLDLLDAEAVVHTLKGEQKTQLLQWVDGLTNKEAAYFYGVKPKAIFNRRRRALNAAVRQANAQ